MPILNKKQLKEDHANGLSLDSVGVCVYRPDSEKKKPLVFLAYKLGDIGVRFTVLDCPPKKLFEKKELLEAVAEAEGVKALSYTYRAGRGKDIYVCRADGGRILDIVGRDYEHDVFEKEFCEILSSKLNFRIKDYIKGDWKVGCAMRYDIGYDHGFEGYDADSEEYALVNAYNACLLGSAFGGEQFDLVTGGGERVRFEVRRSKPYCYDGGTLFFTPAPEDAQVVNYYVSELFHDIDGERMLTRALKLQFRSNQYLATRA